jgi:hypothetical protein
VQVAVLGRERAEDRLERRDGSRSPPTIRQKPFASPQMPPLTPAST